MEQTSLFKNTMPVLDRNYPFQNEAIEEILKEFRRGVDSTALIMATGTGKTWVFTQVAKDFIRRTEKPVLILTHRTELVEQIEGTLERFNVRYAREKAESFAMDSGKVDAVVACTPTMKKQERLEQFPPDFFGLIVTDECHHAVCADNRRIYDYFSGAKHLGATATPLRHDKVGLKNVFQTVAFQYPIQQGIEEGFLCKIKGKRVKVEGLTLENIKLSAGDFSKSELDELLMQEKVLLKMVMPTLEYAQNRQTIVFTQNIKHAQAIAECFNAQAQKRVAVAIDSKMNDAQRRAAINRFKNGEVQFIVNVGVLTEGFDFPPTSCIALFRPTRSLGLLAQMIGRGTRIADGKKDCIVLDFVGVNNSVRTVSVLDVLGGSIISDKEHEFAQKYIEIGEDVKTALQKAKSEVARIIALEMRWKCLSKTNAFDVMKVLAVPSAKGLYGGSLATFAQRGVLENAGIKFLGNLEKGEASLLIGEIVRRTKAGLATLKQLRYLKKLGYKENEIDVENLTFEKASKMIASRAQSRSYSYARAR